METKIRLGVIGTGLAWDMLHWPALQALTDKYEVRAVCNRTISKAQKFAESISLPPDNVYADYRQMLARDDLDAVDVLVPISENFEVARDVLNAGRHLIAEKPFASTPEAAKALIDIKNAKNLLVLVAENFRYDEESRILKSLLSEGTLGEPVYCMQNTGADFEACMTGDTFAAKEWRQHPSFEGGSFLDGGIHDLAHLRFLFGEVSSLSAVGKPHDASYCPYSAINALLRFASGVAVHYGYFAAGGEKNSPPVGLRIFCTKGEIYLESRYCGRVRLFHKDGHTEERPFAPGQGFRLELLNFWEALRHGAPIVSSPEEELGDIELAFAILRAVKENATVTL